MKKISYIVLCLSLSFKLSGQVKEIDISNLTMSQEKFSQVIDMCLDSILKLKQELNIAYQFEIDKEFSEPRTHKELLQENYFLVKLYLNFSLSEIKLKSRTYGNSVLKQVKTYIDWPVMDIEHNDLFFRIRIFSEKFLAEYFFKIKNNEDDFLISGVAKNLSMPHIPLEVMSSMDESKSTMDSLRYKSLMDSIRKDNKRILQKKDKSI